MIRKTVYPQWYQSFWEECSKIRTRSLGSKFEAYNSILKAKITPLDAPYLLECFTNQTDMIRKVRYGGGFIEDHPDLVRWINRRCWENETDQPELRELPKSDQRKAAAARRYLEEDMAEGLEPIGGCEASLGRVGQFDIGVLEKQTP